MRQNDLVVAGIIALALIYAGVAYYSTQERRGLPPVTVWVSNCDAETSFRNGLLHIKDRGKSFDVPREPTRKFLIRKIFGGNCREIEP